jgi:hypothetical protein
MYINNIMTLLDRLKTDISSLNKSYGNNLSSKRSIVISRVIELVDNLDYKVFYELCMLILKSENYYQTNYNDILLLKEVVNSSLFMPLRLKKYINDYSPLDEMFANKLLLE